MVISSCKVITFAIGFIGTKSTPEEDKSTQYTIALDVQIFILEMFLRHPDIPMIMLEIGMNFEATCSLFKRKKKIDDRDHGNMFKVKLEVILLAAGK